MCTALVLCLPSPFPHVATLVFLAKLHRPTHPYPTLSPQLCSRLNQSPLLLYSPTHANTQPHVQAPEMVRIPLEELVLQIHSLRLGPAAQFFERVLEPPPPKSIISAISQLVAVGALTDREQLTPLGAAQLWVAYFCTVHVWRDKRICICACVCRPHVRLPAGICVPNCVLLDLLRVKTGRFPRLGYAHAWFKLIELDCIMHVASMEFSSLLPRSSCSCTLVPRHHPPRPPLSVSVPHQHRMVPYILGMGRGPPGAAADGCQRWQAAAAGSLPGVSVPGSHHCCLPVSPPSLPL